MITRATRILKVLLPLGVLAAGAATAWLLVGHRQGLESRPPPRPVQLVRTQRVELRDLTLKVHSQGTVRPRHESVVASQVRGQIVRVSDAWAAGAFFQGGQVLLEIDPADYELALAAAEEQVARARLRLESELEEAAVARREWERLGREGAAEPPPPLLLREPQVAEARAALEAAEAARRLAALELERTKVRAPPYDGRVQEVSVDLGQYVIPGQALGRVYSIDRAEVPISIPDRELAFLDLPLDLGAGARRLETPAGRAAPADGAPADGAAADGAAGPDVVLEALFAGRPHTWRGRIARTDGEIDPRTRMVRAVVEVERPYDRSVPGRPPLAAGLFVRAEVLGRRVEEVVILPRSALQRPPHEPFARPAAPEGAAGRRQGYVLVVDGASRLRYRQVEILRTQGDEVMVSAGLAAGERVCISPLEIVVDGMQVRVEEVRDGAPAAAGSRGGETR